jgi:hypothetical protein
VQGVYPTSLDNPNLKWEINRKLEVGLELGFLNDRILVQGSYYQNRSSNQLLSAPLSNVTGFGSIVENLPALVQNSGFELMVNTRNIRTKSFSWSTSFNISIPENKLLSFPNLSTSPYAFAYTVGKPTTDVKVFRSLGVNDTTGVYEFADAKGKPTYNPNFATDRTEMINLARKYYGGFENNFQYKGFTLELLLQFVNQMGENIVPEAYAVMPGVMGNQPVQVLDRWQKPGDVEPFQRFSQNYAGSAFNARNYISYSDLSYGNASYIRLKNLSLSWQFSKTTIERLHLQNLRLFVQGQDLFTITKYFGLDPETQGSSLPPIKVLTAGFQITI